MKHFFSTLLLVSLFAPFLMSVTACSGSSNSSAHELHMAAMSDMTTDIQNAPERTSEAYRFAAANPEPLKNVPCFCGCNAIGHTSNYDCYIQDAPTNGKIIFDAHALGCTICVDITQEVMRMTRDGRAPPEIRRAIVTDFSQFGPSNQP